MFLTRLVYASKVSDKFKPEDHEKILTASLSNNNDLKVTGILVYSHKYFLQVLEGGRENVNKIYHKILNDPRHSDPLLISYSTITMRKFSDWNMKVFLSTSINRSQVLKYSGMDDFNPYVLSAESAVQLLEDIIK